MRLENSNKAENKFENNSKNGAEKRGAIDITIILFTL